MHRSAALCSQKSRKGRADTGQLSWTFAPTDRGAVTGKQLEDRQSAAAAHRRLPPACASAVDRCNPTSRTDKPATPPPASGASDPARWTRGAAHEAYARAPFPCKRAAPLQRLLTVAADLKVTVWVNKLSQAGPLLSTGRWPAADMADISKRDAASGRKVALASAAFVGELVLHTARRSLGRGGAPSSLYPLPGAIQS